MLVLSRKKEEEVVIGDGIVVKVLGITGDRVKIGLTAPQTTTIVRGELIGGTKKKDKQQWAGTTESQTHHPTSHTNEPKTEILTTTGNSTSNTVEAS
ncbi:carbon storage regulator [bacterium]|nr:carbon storage regulator [bacterium]